MSAPDLSVRFREFLARRPSLLPEGSSVLVALSGGPDSMALLHLLLEAAPGRGLRLAAAHFDHGLRPESGAEADRVAGWAREAGVPCTVGRASGELRPTQAAFRAARYRFLREVAERQGADRIATGHQADDQVETVLGRVLRGTGLRGLAGIPLRRGPYVRPLLPFRRSEIVAYLTSRGIPYLEDPSNRDPRWTRSRIRHRVLPALEEAAGRAVRARILTLAREARRADRALDRAARAALEACVVERVTARPPPGEGPRGGAATRAGAPAAGGEAGKLLRVRIARDRIAAYDPELQARALRLLARAFGGAPGRGGTRAAVEFIKRGRSGTGIEVSEGLEFWREFDALWLGRRPEHEPDETLSIGDPSPGSSVVRIGGQQYRVAWGTEPPREGHRWWVALPPAGLRFPLLLRGPRPGDRIFWRRGRRKLKKLFGEARVPVSRRPRRPVLVDGAGRILWVAGLGTAGDVVPSEDGERFVIEVGDA